MFRNLARFSYRRRRIVVGGWLLLLVGLLALGNIFGGKPKTNFRLPGSESQQAYDLLKTRGFPSRTGQEVQIVFKADAGVTDPSVKQAMTSLFDRITQNVSGSTIVSPYDAQGVNQVSKDGKIAYGDLQLADRPLEQYPDIADQVKGYAKDAQVPGLEVEFANQLFDKQSGSPSEAIGVIGAVIILLVAFGSVLAMGLPIITAAFGILAGVALGQLAANFLDMPPFTNELTAMIGVGVGIDYALFIVTRFRQGLADGLVPEEAIGRAVDTSGRAVLFAGTTVVISLFGMFLMNLSFMRSLAVAASLGVLMTMLAAMTLLPSVLGFVGRNIDRFAIPKLGGKKQQPAGVDKASIAYKWSRIIQRNPWPALIGGLALLVVLAIPVFSIRFGFADNGNNPTADTSRRGYDLLSQGFGPGFNGAMLAVVVAKDGAKLDTAALAKLRDGIAGTPGVVFPAKDSPSNVGVNLNSGGDAAVMSIIPSTSPQDAATDKLVSHLRETVVPQLIAGTDLTVKLGGATPGARDFADYTLGRLPIVMGAVLIMSFLLLMAVFRSLIVPLKAVVMNLLSIGAAYGVVVAVFQWGWLKGLIGVAKEGPIEAWVPMMLYAIVFGLSMDYEVFLLSRVREEYDRTHNNGAAVADGLAATARVITAAAAIMVCVFFSFVLGDERSIKLFGLGLGIAVLIDASIVRMVLVPAAMELLGEANWWLPSWLNRLLPHISVDTRDFARIEAEAAAGGGGGAGS